VLAELGRHRDADEVLASIEVSATTDAEHALRRCDDLSTCSGPLGTRARSVCSRGRRRW